MNLQWVQRVLAFVLICCLLPAASLCEAPPTPLEAEEASPADAWPVDDPAVTSATFSLGLHLNADAFPYDGQTDFEGWQQFLEKLTLAGTVNSQRFPRNFDRVYFDGDLNLNGDSVLPFTYEGHHSYRYIRSPALMNRSIHFQMHNFFEFMLKPYYYMGLPTNTIAFLLYPEATAALVEAYEDPLADCFAGTGSRTVPYAELYELCETLDQIASDDPDYQRVWYYVTALLIDLQVSDSAFDSLCNWEALLDALDPEQNGMSIDVTGDTETYTLGTTQVFTRTAGADAKCFSLTLPDGQGYTLTVDGQRDHGANGGTDGEIRIRIAAEQETRVDLKLVATGLPKEEDTQAIGEVGITLGGSALGDGETTVSFAFRLTRSATQPPFHVTFGLDWLHPVTKKTALTLLYQADVKMLAETAMGEREYDNQNDFFHLNEGFLAEYKRDFTLPLLLAFAPIALQMPAGVANDIQRFLDQTGILTSLGIE